MDRRNFIKNSAFGYSGLVLGGLAFNPFYSFVASDKSEDH